MSTMTRIGVVGAGRVGAVLAAALRSAGHEIVAVAGESAASRTRIETLLPGVRVDKPTAVSRSCDLLLLTVPDDMLANVVAMLSASGAIRPGQQCRAHLRQARARRPRAGRRPRRGGARDAPGDDLHRHRRGRRPAARLRLRRHRDRRHPAPCRARSSPTSAAALSGSRSTGARSTTPVSRTAPTTWSPWSPRRWTCCGPPAPTDPAGDPAAAAHRRARQRADLRGRRADRPDRARRRGDGARAPRRHRRDPRRPRSSRTSRWPGPPPTGPSLDGRLLPIRAAKLVGILNDALHGPESFPWPPRCGRVSTTAPTAPPARVVARSRAELADVLAAPGRRLAVAPGADHGRAARRSRRAGRRGHASGARTTRWWSRSS